MDLTDLLCTIHLTIVSKWGFKRDAQRVCHACRKISDESLGGDETSFERLATKLSQVTVNFIVDYKSFLLKQWNVSVEEFSADSCHAEI